MTSQSLVVHPRKGKDEVLNFALKCALEIKNHLKNSNLPFKHLHGNCATNHHVKNELAIMDGGNFLAFGHGSPDFISITGGAPVFSISDTHLTQNKICYFVSCCTAKNLGPKTMSDGALAFIGFNGNFIVPKYHKNELIECVISGISKFLIGECKLSEVEKITDTTFNHYEKKLIQSNELLYATTFAHNKNEMVFLFK